MKIGDKVRFIDKTAERDLPTWIKHGILPEWIKGLDGEIIKITFDLSCVHVRFIKGDLQVEYKFHCDHFGIGNKE